MKKKFSQVEIQLLQLLKLMVSFHLKYTDKKVDSIFFLWFN